MKFAYSITLGRSGDGRDDRRPVAAEPRRRRAVKSGRLQEQSPEAKRPLLRFASPLPAIASDRLG